MSNIKSEDIKIEKSVKNIKDKKNGFELNKAINRLRKNVRQAHQTKRTLKRLFNQ